MEALRCTRGRAQVTARLRESLGAPSRIEWLMGTPLVSLVVQRLTVDEFGVKRQALGVVANVLQAFQADPRPSTAGWAASLVYEHGAVAPLVALLDVHDADVLRVALHASGGVLAAGEQLARGSRGGVCSNPFTLPFAEALVGPSRLLSAPLGSSRLLSAPLGSARLLSAPLGSARLLSAPLGSARLRSAPLGSSRLLSAPLGPSRLLSAPLGSARLLSAPLGSSRLRSAPLGSARLLSAPLGPSRLRSAPLGPSRLRSAPLGPSRLRSAPLGSSRPLSAPLGPSRPLSAALGSARPLSAPLGSSRLLSAPLGPSRLLSAPLGSSRLLSAPLVSSRLLSAPLGLPKPTSAHLCSSVLRPLRCRRLASRSSRSCSSTQTRRWVDARRRCSTGTLAGVLTHPLPPRYRTHRRCSTGTLAASETRWTRPKTPRRRTAAPSRAAARGASPAPSTSFEAPARVAGRLGAPYFLYDLRTGCMALSRPPREWACAYSVCRKRRLSRE